RRAPAGPDPPGQKLRSTGDRMLRMRNVRPGCPLSSARGHTASPARGTRSARPPQVEGKPEIRWVLDAHRSRTTGRRSSRPGIAADLSLKTERSCTSCPNLCRSMLGEAHLHPGDDDQIARSCRLRVLEVPADVAKVNAAAPARVVVEVHPRCHGGVLTE